MKKLILCFVFVVLVGCSGHYSAESFDTVAIESEAKKILESNTIDLKKLPFAISKLDPKDVKINSDGLYIRLEALFVSESGLFIPRNGTAIIERLGGDPEFKLLSDNVYSYIIRG